MPRIVIHFNATVISEEVDASIIEKVNFTSEDELKENLIELLLNEIGGSESVEINSFSIEEIK